MNATHTTRATTRKALGTAALLSLTSALGLATLMMTLPAHAQAPKKDEVPVAPTPTKEDEDAPAIMNILTMALIALVVLGVSAIPSKRGHQD